MREVAQKKEKKGFSQSDALSLSKWRKKGKKI